MKLQHPGKILQHHYLTPMRLSQNRLARCIRVPPRRINEIIHGKRAISTDTAIRLGLFFGPSANATFWITMQAKYDIQQLEPKIRHELHTLTPTAEPPQPTGTNRPGNDTAIKKRILR